jgi:hypothetical protein
MSSGDDDGDDHRDEKDEVISDIRLREFNSVFIIAFQKVGLCGTDLLQKHLFYNSNGLIKLV